MKCPLFFMGWLASEGKSELIDVHCLKEECALWDKDKAMCFRASETVELRFIRSILREIRDKMPKWEQFGK